jgi:hypothetical protein
MVDYYLTALHRMVIARPLLAEGLGSKLYEQVNVAFTCGCTCVGALRRLAVLVLQYSKFLQIWRAVIYNIFSFIDNQSLINKISSLFLVMAICRKQFAPKGMFYNDV